MSPICSKQILFPSWEDLNCSKDMIFPVEALFLDLGRYNDFLMEAPLF